MVALERADGSGRRPPAGALAARVRALELVAQLPDAVDITSTAGIDAVPAYRAETLVVGGQRQLWVVELIEVGAQQGRAQPRFVRGVAQVGPPVQQGRP